MAFKYAHSLILTSPSSISRTFHLPKLKFHTLSTITFHLPLLQPLEITILLFLSMNLAVKYFLKKYHTIFVLYDWLISLTMMCSGFILIVAWVKTVILFKG